jgi:pimeloyl-ACP methyl ester carboxylesterase
MPTVTVQGNRIYYKQTGHGPPLVFLHGNPGTHRLWQHQLDHFKSRYSLIAVDMRGFGRSAKPAGADYHPYALARDIAELIAILGLQHPILAGLSMGSMVGLSLALEHPDRIGGLILAGTTSDRRDRDPEKELQRLAQLGFDQYLRKLVTSWYRPGTDPDLIEWTLCEVRTTELHVRESTIRALASFYVTDRLYQINIPTLILAGGKDITAPCDRAQLIRDRIPGAELAVIPDTAHMFIVEAADQVNQIIDAFLHKIRYH